MTTRASVSVQSLLLVEALVPEATVEAPDEAVLPGAARIGINGLDLVLCQPALHFFSDKLRAVVTPQEHGRTVFLDGSLQPGEHVNGPQGTLGPKHVTLSGVLIEDGEHLESAAAYRGIADEVPGPHVPAVRGFGGQPGGDPTAHDLALGRRHAQSIGTPQALDVAFTHRPAFLA